MKYLLYILIGISGIMISCTGETGTHFPRYPYFTNEKFIRAQVNHLDTVLFRYPFRVAVSDSFAIVLDLHNADNYFHAFTYPEWKHVISFGKRGEAPEEMLSAENFQFNSLDSIWALDANKMEITRWAISPADRSVKRVQEIKLDKNLIRSLDFYAMETCFLTPDYLGEHRFSRVDYQGKLIDSEGSIPSETANEDTSLPALAQAWRCFIDYNPENNTLAMVTQLGETLEIYNLKENTRKVLYGPAGEPKFKATPDGHGIPVGIKGFCDVEVTDRYIYAVYQGTKFKDIVLAARAGKHLEDGGRFIYVFDLEGTPVCKYVLDHPVSGINVNEATNTIVGITVESDDPIIEFKI